MESDVSESEDVSEEITNERVEEEFMPAFHNVFNLFKPSFFFNNTGLQNESHNFLSGI